MLDTEHIKKLKKGELVGHIATALCAVIFVFFVICFTVGTVRNIPALRLSALIISPVLLVIFVSVAAVCNIKFSAEIDRQIKRYVQQVFIENAALMHPERDSLTFHFSIAESSFIMTVNGYKEKIVFDFSALGKISSMRKSTICTAIENKLCSTFCVLMLERNATYNSVGYTSARGDRNKVNFIIKDGKTDSRAYKIYRKS